MVPSFYRQSVVRMACRRERREGMVVGRFAVVAAGPNSIRSPPRWLYSSSSAYFRRFATVATSYQLGLGNGYKDVYRLAILAMWLLFPTLSSLMAYMQYLNTLFLK
ncbi:hypothetical protein GUJ93_ZPchr0009g509 [Zizania palustris]|uniref:Uncharacterized protein n=1 Tax=Zizania palustris TaxID=103762 RepID=A0A8J5RFK9_ZIZPA|nr:hypothetical protein GUJ93_ZPchr0009g509 [Zizania palustris]